MTLTDATQSKLPWHLRNNWAPVHDERTDVGLRVDGVVPAALTGTYVRTGPNPASGTSAHWFFGDGMVHGVRLAGGKAEWYRNRFVQTLNITDPIGDPMMSMGDLTRGTGNTHVIPHNKKLLCLEEGHWPWQIDMELNTVGFENFDGALTCSMTAHPKVCPVTGELIAFSYLSPEPPFLRYIRISAEGQVTQLEGIDIPNMVMMHDFNVTENYVVFMDLPLCFDLGALESGLPFRFNRDAGARLGVMPRHGTNADVRWFEIDPCYVFHPVNADEAGNTIVLHVSRQPEAFGTSTDDYAEVGRLWRWTIDLDAGTVREEQVDDRPGDFGRVDDRRVGLDARYGYLMAMAGEGVSDEPIYGSALWKYDLHSGACDEHHLGEGVRGAEPVFVPASPEAGEDEGWVISLAHDTKSDESRLLIIDAQNFSAPPVAMVHIPRRVPYGAHGLTDWVPDHVSAERLMSHDLVLAGGRVVDPETGFDRVCDVGIDGGSVTAVGDGLDGATTVDVGELVVAPGFVDLHSHAQTLPGRRLQACDGVTTALDLEAGRAPVDIAYAREAERGSPINYGFSASWAAARMHAVADAPLDGGLAALFGGLTGTEWQRAATAAQVARILDQISTDLAAGAVGIGVLMGYTPGVDPAEYLAVAELAAAAEVPTFTHSRDIVELAPETLIDGAEEVVRAAGATGAHMHYCHINSTSGRHIDRVLSLVGRCQTEGARVTTEAYPYGSGSTAIGAAFLSPERLRERFRGTTSITYLRTGERIADDDRLRELRASDPGGLVIADFLDESEPSDAALLRRSLAFPDAIVASDAMPPLWTDTTGMDVTAWPLPPEAVTHPRTAGTFGRALRLWRQEGAPLMEALRRMTLLPVEVLQDAVPAMRHKGRVQPGTDADLVVFEQARVTDQATYVASTRASSGIAHVIVNGTFVVRDGELVPDALPGRPVRASPL